MAVVGCDPSALLRTCLRVVFGPGDFEQVVPKRLPVVGDGENMLLNSEMDRVGVERRRGLWDILFRGIGGVIGLWIPAFAGMTVGRVGAGSGSEGVVQGVVDLGNEPGGLGFVVGYWLFGASIGSRVGARAGGGWLLGAFAESSVEEDGVGGDAVVGGGLFVDAIGDVAQNLDELECAVGLFESR